jgi:hypothetical protein
MHKGQLHQLLDEAKKRAESDANVIASMNRYIAALEGRAAHQEELIKELRERLTGLLPGKNKEDT